MNKEFTATLVQSEAKGGWTYLIWPESAARRAAPSRGASRISGPGY